MRFLTKWNIGHPGLVKLLSKVSFITWTQMLNKLKNFRSLGSDAIPACFAPEGHQVDISLGVVFLSSKQQPETFKWCCEYISVKYHLWWWQHWIKQPKTYKTMFIIVLKLLKVDGKIRASTKGSRPKDMAEIMIKLANSYQTSLWQAEQGNPNNELQCSSCHQSGEFSQPLPVIWK